MPTSPAESTGSGVVAGGLSCCPYYGIFPDRTHVSCIGGRFFTTESPGKPYYSQFFSPRQPGCPDFPPKHPGTRALSFYRWRAGTVAQGKASRTENSTSILSAFSSRHISVTTASHHSPGPPHPCPTPGSAPPCGFLGFLGGVLSSTRVDPQG